MSVILRDLAPGKFKDKAKGMLIKAGEKYEVVVDIWEVNATLGAISLQMMSNSNFTVELESSIIPEISDKIEDYETLTQWYPLPDKTTVYPAKSNEIFKFDIALCKYLKFIFTNDGEDAILQAWAVFA